MYSGSCPEFGVSGSGIAREWKARKDQSGAVLADEESEALYQYSFVGPLSMSKGCDLTHQPDYLQRRGIDRKKSNLPEFVYRGKTQKAHHRRLNNTIQENTIISFSQA